MILAKFDEYEDLLTCKEVERILRISRAGVYRLIRNGQLRAVVIGQNYRIHKESVAALLFPEVSKGQ